MIVFRWGGVLFLFFFFTACQNLHFSNLTLDKNANVFRDL